MLIIIYISESFDFIPVRFKRRVTKEFLVCTNESSTKSLKVNGSLSEALAVDTKSTADSSEPLCNCLTMRIPSSAICAMFDLSA